MWKEGKPLSNSEVSPKGVRRKSKDCGENFGKDKVLFGMQGRRGERELCTVLLAKSKTPVRKKRGAYRSVLQAICWGLKKLCPVLRTAEGGRDLENRLSV